MSIFIKPTDLVHSYFFSKIVSTIINELEDEVDFVAAEKEKEEFKDLLAPFAGKINGTEPITIESRNKNNISIIMKIMAYSTSQRIRQDGWNKRILKRCENELNIVKNLSCAAHLMKKRDDHLIQVKAQRRLDDAFFDELIGIFQMPAVSELEVATWQCKEVETWARYYGFYEDQVISYIVKCNLNGSHLISSGITAEEIGISTSLGIAMFKIRIEELQQRDLKEKAMHVFVKANVSEEEDDSTESEEEESEDEDEATVVVSEDED
jgi:hypothetical protein